MTDSNERGKEAGGLKCDIAVYQRLLEENIAQFGMASSQALRISRILDRLILAYHREIGALDGKGKE